MKLYLPLVVAAAALTFGCSPMESEDEKRVAENDKLIQSYITANSVSPTKTTSGLYYQLKNSNPTGRKPEVGEQISVTMVIRNLSGTVINDYYQINPFKMVYHTGGTSFTSLLEGASYMREGENIMMLAPYYLAYGSGDLKDSTGRLLLPGYSPVRVDMTLVKTRNEEEQIRQYLIDNKLTLTDSTSDGLRYIRKTAGTGAAVTNGKTVKLKYTGRLITGGKFDESTDGSFSVTMGVANIITGFSKGLLMMKQGEKATIIFPSSLGYGTQGVANQNGYGYYIMPYSPLVFDIEVVSVE